MILEVGSGTGVITSDLNLSFRNVFGLDIDPSVLAFAKQAVPAAKAVCADGHALPFPAETFDLALCHFLLLWVENPVKVLIEMRRVTRRGGWVLALAEPDYGARIDYPDDLRELGQLQMESLRRRGADPRIGRKLRACFHASGLIDVRAGVLGGEWQSRALDSDYQCEWRTLEADLQDLMPINRLRHLKGIDQQAALEGRRILYVPTFYAMGKSPGSEGRAP
jgi:SAM-dependent methyltransferase